MSPRGRFAKTSRWIVPAGLLALVAIQFVRVDRTNPPVRTEVDASDAVAAILHRACYDCHSNETRWPWYSAVAPASWLLARHVHEGRSDLNFSEWPAFDPEELGPTLDGITRQVERGKMPLRSYTWLHPGARLSADDRRTLLEWSRQAAADLTDE